MIKGQVFDSPPDFRGIAKGVSRSMGVGPPFSKGKTTTIQYSCSNTAKVATLLNGFSNLPNTLLLVHSFIHSFSFTILSTLSSFYGLFARVLVRLLTHSLVSTHFLLLLRGGRAHLVHP